MSWRALSPEFSVAGQIALEELIEIAQAGFKSIICNRPDREDPGQPDFAVIAQAASTLGMQAHHVPAVSGQVTPEHARILARLLQETPGPVLAYCRSGARSSTMWQLAQGM
jgi:sulfide:quinone oxidoreductase